jgi:prolyl oligopeptidase
MLMPQLLYRGFGRFRPTVSGCDHGVGVAGFEHHSTTSMRHRFSQRSFVALLAITGLGCSHAQSFVYPSAERGSVSDTFHGTKVADPYRWLEDSESAKTKSWIAAQNKLSAGHLATLPDRKRVRKRLEKLWNYERFGAPRRVGSYYYFRHNSGLQQHSVLMATQGLNGKPSLLLDPNTFSKDGSISLASYAPSEDAKWLAYMVSDGGSDWRSIRVMKTADRTLHETLKWVKWSGVSWRKDGSGFYYSRYAEPEDKLQQRNLNHRVFFHRIGTEQSADLVVFAQPDHPEWHLGAWVSDDDSLLWFYASRNTNNENRLWYQRLDRPNAPLVPVVRDFSAGSWPIGKIAERVWIKTNLKAPTQRVMRLELERPEPKDWVEVVPQRKETLRSAAVVGGQLLLNYLKDAHAQVERRDLDGKLLGKLPLPGVGSVWGLGGRVDDPEVFYLFSDFTRPTSIYRLDLKSATSSLYRSPKVAFDSDAYITKQVFFHSKDGTRIPMFITHKKGLGSGPHPTLLYGYGGFNVSLTPGFSVGRAVWLEQGGIYAVPNLRGGGEYGEAWHKAGVKTEKQNVFDDFIAAAEHLINSGLTAPSKLAIAGASNGGLLVGASLLQRPDLFAASLPNVGVMDMLRYHRFTVGKLWASDYGTVDDAAEFKALVAYSPVHNVVKGRAYPATLITTADHDDRVVPAHSFKFAAALQYGQGGAAPALIRIETRAGHGAGMALSLKMDKLADQYAFVMYHLGMSAD